MDGSLEEYISHKPTLQAAITGAKLRAKHSRRAYNSDEFRGESRHYICPDMDPDIDMEKGGNISKTNGNDSNESKSPFDEAYLALDINEEEEFDKWYEQLNSNITAKQPAVSKKEFADSSNDKKKNNCKKNETKKASKNIDNLLKKPGFDLRQLVSGHQPNEQGDIQLQQSKQPLQWHLNSFAANGDGQLSGNQGNFMSNGDAKFSGNHGNFASWKGQRPGNQTSNNNYKHRQKHGGVKNNRFAVNYAPYYNRRAGNEQFGNGNINFSNIPNACSHNDNGIQMCHNQGMFGHIAGNTRNFGCCTSHHEMPLNMFQNCDCNRNGLNFNVNSQANHASCLASGFKPCGCNSLGAFNAPMALTSAGFLAGGGNNGGCCGYNSVARAFNTESNILKDIFKSTAGCAGNSNDACSQLSNRVKKMLNAFGTDAQAATNQNSGNDTNNSSSTATLSFSNRKSTNTNDANMENDTLDNNPSSLKGKSIASVLGLTSKDFEIESVPAFLGLMQQIFENGVTIKMSNGKN